METLRYNFSCAHVDLCRRAWGCSRDLALSRAAASCVGVDAVIASTPGRLSCVPLGAGTESSPCCCSMVWCSGTTPLLDVDAWSIDVAGIRPWRWPGADTVHEAVQRVGGMPTVVWVGEVDVPPPPSWVHLCAPTTARPRSVRPSWHRCGDFIRHPHNCWWWSGGHLLARRSCRPRPR